MSALESIPKTTVPITVLTTKTMAEQIDCTPQVLDLCVRRTNRQSPTPEGAHHVIKTSQEVHSSIPDQSPNYLFPNNNNNIDFKFQKSPINHFQTSPIHDQFQNNNFIDQFNKPAFNMHIDQFQNTAQHIYRPFPVQADTDSSEEGSVKSDATDFSNVIVNMSVMNGKSDVKTKATRPFKAYPKDPFFLALGACSADAILGKESAEAYAEFRQKMLSQVRANNPEPGVTNTKMRRSNLPTSTQEMDGKDASYWEKRRKNNEAAKRSRDARRAKEDEIAIRAAFLEQENLKLKYENAALRNETTKLRCLLYN